MKLACLLLAACASAAHPRPPTTPDALLDASAGDFRAHGPPVAEVRNVRFGHVDGRALVCGDFRATDGWSHFATVSTSGYEQWLGAGADRWCDGPHAQWETGGLSAALLARLR